MASTNALANDIMGKIDSALDQTTGPYFDMQTARANMSAAAQAINTDAGTIKTETDGTAKSVEDIYGKLETVLEALDAKFTQSSDKAIADLEGRALELATPIDQAKLEQGIDIKTYIPTSDELEMVLDPIPKGADRGISDVSGSVLGKINDVAKPVAAKGMEAYGLDKDFVPQSVAAAEKFASQLFTDLAGVIRSQPVRPVYNSLNVVEGEDLDQYMPDFALIKGRYLEVMSSLDEVGSGPNPMDYAIDSFEYVFTALWDDLSAVVARNLKGGTGLDPTAEQAVWDRHRQRMSKVIDAEVRRATMAVAGKGYSMPPGRLNTVLKSVTSKYTDENIDASAEIAGKQAELMQSNMIHAVDSALKLEELNSTIFVKNKQLEMEYKKFLLGTATELFKIHIDQIKAKAELLISAGRLYELELENLKAHLEMFKAKLEQERNKVNMNQALVEQYKAEISAIAAQVDGYKIVGDTIKVMLDVDQLGAQIFTNKAQAYSAYLQAVGADYKRFEVEIKAASTETDIQEILTRAYSAEINGIDTKNSAEIKRVGAIVERFSRIVDASGNELKAGELEINRYVKTQGAYTEKYKTNIESDLTKLEAALRAYDAGMKGGAAKKDIMMSKIELLKYKLEKYAEMVLKGDEAQVTTYSKEIDAIGKVLGAAYASVNAIGIDFKKGTI